MESLGVYEDLSLFNGDLVGVGSPPVECPVLAPDGLSDGLIKYHSLRSSVLVTADDYQLQDAGTGDGDWMEKKMDLIKLLSDPNVEVTITSTPSPSAETIDLDQIAEKIPVFYQIPEATLSPVQSVDDLDQLSRQDSLQNFADILSLNYNTTSGINTSSSQEFSGFGEDEHDFNNDGFLSFLTEEELGALEGPILSPVSPDDVESILSSMPSSPQSVFSIDVPDIMTHAAEVSGVSQQTTFSPPPAQEKQHDAASGPVRSVRSSRLKKYSPYQDCYDDDDFAPATSSTSRSGHKHRSTDRKERKKQQNKDAALRYRLKKKQEHGSIFTECEALEKTNTDLKDKVDGMEREIQYLKDLLLDVYKAKGIQPSQMLINSK